MAITFDKTGFYIDGKKEFLISGEFPYFRVPKKDWEARLKLLKECGCNAVASYVPWILHEPDEAKRRIISPPAIFGKG